MLWKSSTSEIKCKVYFFYTHTHIYIYINEKRITFFWFFKAMYAQLTTLWFLFLFFFFSVAISSEMNTENQSIYVFKTYSYPQKWQNVHSAVKYYGKQSLLLVWSVTLSYSCTAKLAAIFSDTVFFIFFCYVITPASFHSLFCLLSSS